MRVGCGGESREIKRKREVEMSGGVLFTMEEAGVERKGEKKK